MFLIKFPLLTKNYYLSAVIKQSMVTEELKRLYYEYTGSQAEDITELPSSGSNRRYFRISGPETLIGVSGSSQEENKAFIYMSGFSERKVFPSRKYVFILKTILSTYRKTWETQCFSTPLKRT